MSALSIKVEVKPGANIPGAAIPELIRLADRIGVPVEATMNGVTVIAHPGDDALDLAVSWEHESRLPERDVKVARAASGREHRARMLANQ